MKRFDPYQIISILLGLAILGAVGFFAYNMTRGGFGKAALDVSVVYGNGRVLVDGKDLGETPVYTEKVQAGDINVKINGETNSYETSIRPAAGTMAVVKRDLGVNGAFSSGQNIWFTRSGEVNPVVSVISPDTKDVSVIVDGVEIGKTPKRFSTKDLLSQNEEDKYTLSFKKDGYETQEIQVKLKQGYELNIRIDMYLNPIPAEITPLNGLPEGVRFLSFGKAANEDFNDKQSWAKAINYYLRTRGEKVIGNNKVSEFNYFLTDDGKFYSSAGNEISPSEVQLQAEDFVAYLAVNKGDEVSEQAKAALSESLGGGVTVASGGEGSAQGTGTKIEIIETGIGYLRVRSSNSTGASELGRVNVGEQFDVIEESNGWYKIEYETGKQGWISGTYTKKL